MIEIVVQRVKGLTRGDSGVEEVQAKRQEVDVGLELGGGGDETANVVHDAVLRDPIGGENGNHL